MDRAQPDDRRLMTAAPATIVTVGLLIALALVAFAPAQVRTDAVVPALRILAPHVERAADGNAAPALGDPLPRGAARAGTRPVCIGAFAVAASWRALDLPPPTTA